LHSKDLGFGIVDVDR